MNCVLKSFDVLSKSGDELAHFELFRRGAVLEVRTRREVVHAGVGAEKYYRDAIETNRLLCMLSGNRVVERR